MRDYKEAVEFFERLRFLGTNLVLGNIRQLLRLSGNPQNELRFVHIAGTNGKGSTAAFLASILREAGYRVGLYTSPYLTKLSDVIRVDGAVIPDADFARYTGLIAKLMHLISEGSPTEFEVLTAVAFRYFADRKVDVVVLETGLGGKNDATNVIAENLMSVFTHIAMDHQEYLGNTLERIAAEKAGIIKGDSIVVTTEQEPSVMRVLIEEADRKNNRVVVSDPDKTHVLRSSLDELVVMIGDVRYDSALIGLHQKENLSLAVACATALRDFRGFSISQEAVRRGVSQVEWLGRLQKLSDSPEIYADGAHNLDGVRTLIRTFRALAPNRPITAVYGAIRRPDLDEILAELAGFADELILTEPRERRAMPLAELEEKVKKFDRPVLLSTVRYDEIVRFIVSRPITADRDQPIYLAFGSLYFIREFLPVVERRLRSADGAGE